MGRLSSDEFAKMLAGKKGGITLRTDADMFDSGCRRFSSGIYSLDRALGRGFPFGRIVLISGPESSGKSTVAYRAMGAVQQYDETQRVHRAALAEGSVFVPGKTLLIDAEASYTPEWVASHLDPTHVHVAPTSFVEEVGDLVAAAIYYNSYSLIVIDSLAALITKGERERSLDDMSIGEVAKLLSRSFRKWTNELSTVLQQGAVPPCIILINQLRDKIGVMYGDKTELPGGKAQKYYAAIHISMRAGKKDSEDTKDKNTPHKVVTLAGYCKKNKTATPQRPFEFELSVFGSSSGEHVLGEIDNVRPMFKDALEHGIAAKTDNGLLFEGVEYPTQKAFREALYKDILLQEQLRQALMKVV